MRKILVYLAHPRLDRSEIHANLIDTVSNHPATTLVNLYAEYPDFYVDVEKEQNRLREHDAIVFQHPVFWYSTPSIMKEWQDLVLEYGFAYGQTGKELAGKAFGQVVSAGSTREDYTRKGAKEFTLEELFSPLKATARLCSMTYLPPLPLYASGSALEDGRLDGFKQAYKSYLDALADPSTPFADLVKRDDLISTIRNFMRV